MCLKMIHESLLGYVLNPYPPTPTRLQYEIMQIHVCKLKIMEIYCPFAMSGFLLPLLSWMNSCAC